MSILQEMRNDVAGKDLSAGQYVGVRAKGKGVTKIEKTLLLTKRAEYPGEILPESEEQSSAPSE